MTIQLNSEEMERIRNLDPINNLNVMQNLMAIAHHHGVWMDGPFDYDFETGVINYPARKLKVEFEE